MATTKRAESRIHFRFDVQESCLYVDAQENFGTALRFLPWKKGLICERFSDKKGWVREYADPGIPLITLCNDQTLRTIADGHLESDLDPFHHPPAEQHPIELFVNLIPQIVRELAAPFIYRQIPLLQYFCAVPEAVELARSNPILLWLLVDKIAQAEADPADFRQVGFANPMKILRTIHQESDDVSLSFISKISFQGYSERAMKTIRECLKDTALLGRLCSFHKIPGAVLEQAINKPIIRNSEVFFHLLGSMNGMESPQITRRILAEGNRLIRDCSTLGRQLCLENVKERISNCGTMAQLKKLYRRWKQISDIARMAEVLKVEADKAGVLDKMTSRRIGRIHDGLVVEMKKNSRESYFKGILEKYGSIMFPAPPLKGNEFIVPIRDAGELYDESIEMHHCVSTYVDAIMQKQCYIYTVIKPQRATLEVRLNKEFGNLTSSPALGQLKLKRNTLPSAETLSLINSWLRNAAKTLGE